MGVAHVCKVAPSLALESLPPAVPEGQIAASEAATCEASDGESVWLTAAWLGRTAALGTKGSGVGRDRHGRSRVSRSGYARPPQNMQAKTLQPDSSRQSSRFLPPRPHRLPHALLLASPGHACAAHAMQLASSAEGLAMANQPIGRKTHAPQSQG